MPLCTIAGDYYPSTYVILVSQIKTGGCGRNQDGFERVAAGSSNES
jgi:hypothetical protein